MDIKFGSLFDAVNRGTVADVLAVIKSGADVDSKRFGITPLMLAASENYFDKVKMLLEHGADATVKDADEHTALDHAKLNGASNELVHILEAYMDDAKRNAEKAKEGDLLGAAVDAAIEPSKWHYACRDICAIFQLRAQKNILL